MAEAPEDQEEGAGEEPSKGGALKWIIIAVVVTVVLGGGAAVWFFVLGGEDEKPKAAKSGEKGAEVPLAGPIISLKTFIVNLADPGGRRYLKVKLDLELTNREVEKELRARLPEVREEPRRPTEDWGPQK